MLFVDRSPEYNEHFCYKLDHPPPPPLNLFLPHPDPSLGRYGWNILLYVQGHEHLIPTILHKHPLSGSVVKADYASHTYTCISAPPSPPK